MATLCDRASAGRPWPARTVTPFHPEACTALGRRLTGVNIGVDVDIGVDVHVNIGVDVDVDVGTGLGLGMRLGTGAWVRV